MRVQREILIIILTLAVSCGFNQDKNQPATFYNTISGWDIIYIPIIAPYKATSLDDGETWSLNKAEIDPVGISSFGVSQNFIYGYGQTGWFLFDTKSKLFAEYQSQEELINSLKSFNIPINAITNCNSYFDSLTKGKTCYWFPKAGQNYPIYPDMIPNEVTTITVSENSQKQPDFQFKKTLKYHNNKIYFFKIEYNKKENDLYYLSFDNSRPILVKDELLIPIFSAKTQFDITLYTPYPIAQEKGISEDKRFLKSKTVFIDKTKMPHSKVAAKK